MAAPEYVPQRPTDDPRSYKSPPRRPQPWLAERPGELMGAGQPRADRLGHQGPDQGYVYRLVGQFDGRLHLTEGEHHDDVVAGCVGVALKRASLFGRAPIVHDLTVAFTVWGYLDAGPPADLVEVRRAMFAEARNPHHYEAQRVIVDAVPETTLRRHHSTFDDAHRTDWRDLLDVEAARLDVAAVAVAADPDSGVDPGPGVDPGTSTSTGASAGAEPE